MEKIFKVSVNEEFEFEFSEEEIRDLDTFDLSPRKSHLLKDHRSFSAEVLHSDFGEKAYSVQIKSNVYRIRIWNELDQLIEEMGLSAVVPQGGNEITAPMPGMILEVNVAPGEEVKQGDFLLVLEAMKMENTITAPRDGTVKAVHIKKGGTVEKNQLLIEMEA